MIPLPIELEQIPRALRTGTRLVLLWVGVAAALPAEADTVILEGGDRLSGKIVHASKENLTLDTEYAGKLQVAWKNIATLSTDAPIEVLRLGSETPERMIIEQGEAGTVRVRHADAEEWYILPLQSLTYLNPKPEESGNGLSYQGRVNLSATWVRGNSSSDRVYAEAELKARAKAYRNAFEAKFQREDESGERTTSRSVVAANHDRFLGERRFWYLRGSLEHDRFKDIELRTTLGAGYGSRVIDTERTELSLRAGLDAVWLDRITDGDEKYPALGWGIGFSHWLTNRTLQVFHDQQGFWNLEDLDQASLRSKTGVRVPVAERLTASAQLNLDWESEPAPGLKSIDTTWLLGLNYYW